MAGPFQPEEEKRSELGLLLRSRGISDWSATATILWRLVQQSITVWESTVSDREKPEDLTRLRHIARLVLSNDPQIFLIRKRVAELPDRLVRLLQARAQQISRLDPIYQPLQRDLIGWSKTCRPAELVPLLRVCLIGGGELVPGRLRPSGRRSISHFEPMIVGRGRGLKGVEKRNGGRDRNDELYLLIAFLAVDWLKATGLAPEKGRSDRTPFGALVFMVFRWIGEAEKAPHSLRRYWFPVTQRSHRTIPSWDLSQG